MNKIVSLLLFFITLNLLSQEYWIKKTSPTTKWLYKCSYTDSLNIWAAGDSGVIIHTSNGGINWVVQENVISSFIEDIFFVNPRIGWAISNDFLYIGTIILKTTNGGTNWEVTRYPDTTLIINTVYFVDSLNIFLGGFEGTILKSTNAGSSWIRCLVDSNYFRYHPIRKFSFLNSQYGIVCAGAQEQSGSIWRTTNYGYNWIIVDTTPEPNLDIIYYNENLAFSSGGEFEYGSSFSRSFSGGNSWIDSNIYIWGVGYSLGIRSLKEMWVPLGFSCFWMFSKDTGVTWTSVDTPDSIPVYDVIFITPKKGWAFGVNGSILKYVPADTIGIKNNQLPVSADLFQNYPNPFNPSTTISYSVVKPSKVKITLYDVTGKEIEVLLNEFKYAGIYEFRVNSEGLSSAVYFYKLESQGFTVTKKMVILK